MLQANYKILYIYFDLVIGWMSSMFANGPGDGVQSQVESYQRLKKMLLGAALLNTQHY